jgi:outer membrane biosynthesis protein TonB
MTTRASTTDAPAPAAPRKRISVGGVQFLVLILIVLLVGLMAGAASFTHVKEWTLDNSPADTAEWFGWANAVISELIPTAALIEIGRRRRRDAHASVRYPMVLLFGAVGFSLTAQLAVAKPGVSGWVVSALPALAFLGLSKLVFSATSKRPTTNPVTADTPATSPAQSSDTTRVEVRPAAANRTRATTPAKKAAPAKKTTPAKRTPAKKTPAPAAAEPAPAPETTEPTAPAPAVPEPRYPDALLNNARTIVASHRETNGNDINAGQLAVRLRVSSAIARDLLTKLESHPTLPDNTRPHNGTPIGAVR